MERFYIRTSTFEVKKNRVASLSDLIYVALESGDSNIYEEFTDYNAALSALKNEKNQVYEASGRIGRILVGKVYFATAEEWDDCDFVEESSRDACENWDSTDAEIFGGK